jgi:hypothetical protein
MALGLAGCEKKGGEGPAERAGKQVDQAVQQTGRRSIKRKSASKKPLRKPSRKAKPRRAPPATAQKTWSRALRSRIPLYHRNSFRATNLFIRARIRHRLVPPERWRTPSFCGGRESKDGGAPRPTPCHEFVYATRLANTIFAMPQDVCETIA